MYNKFESLLQNQSLGSHHHKETKIVWDI